MAKGDVLPNHALFPVLVEMEFDRLVTEYKELAEMEADCAKRRKDLGEQIQAALTVAEVDKVEWNQHPVSMRRGCSPSKIDGKLLASKGVSTDIIKECTIAGTPYTYVFIDKSPEERAMAKAAKEDAQA